MLLSDEISEKIMRIVKLKSGEGVFIRLAQEYDKEKVWDSYKNQPKEFFNFIPDFSKELVDVWYSKIDHAHAIPINAFLYENDQETKFIGNCTFLPFDIEKMSHVMAWGINIITEYQQKGLGTHLISLSIDIAKNLLKLKRLELDIVIENERALNLYKKMGFKTEGRFIERWALDDSYHDMLKMAIIFN